MNYSKIYKDLIDKAILRDEGIESHHITPRCLGGADDQENLVLLSLREHFMCHKLLAKIHPGCNGLLLAYRMMAYRCGYSRDFERSRKEFIDAASDLVSDGWARKRGFESYEDQCIIVFSEYVDNMDSVSDISKRYNLSESNVQKSIRNAAVLMGRESDLKSARRMKNSERAKKNRNNFTPEQEARRLEAVKAVDRTDYIERLKTERKGAGNPMFGRKRVSEIIECPHCGKTGAASQMKRWHMDNCKEKMNG